MRLRFWLKSGLEILGMTVGISAFYCALMWIQMEDGGWLDVLSILPVYLIVLGALLFAVTAIGQYRMTVSLVLSFGSTRREVLMGLQIYRLLPTVCIALLAALLTMLPGVAPVFSPYTTFLLSLGAFLLGGAAGALLGMVTYRFGKVGTVITIISMALLGFGLGLLAVFSVDGQSRLYALAERGELPWLCLALGAAAYLLMMIPESRVVRSYQVRQ